MLLQVLSTYFLIFLYGLVIIYNKEEYIKLVEFNSIIFFKHDQHQFLVLAIGGVFVFYHYHFYIKAFENGSCTVILPFLQFAPIFAMMLQMA